MKTIICLVVVMMACAKAVPPSEEVDASDSPDALTSTADARPGFPDVRPMPDARPGIPDAPPFVPIDAALPGTPDAALGGICSSNVDCPDPAECCLIAICVVGTELGDLCLPG